MTQVAPNCSQDSHGNFWGTGCTSVSFSTTPTSITVSATAAPVDALSDTAQATLSQVSTNLGYGPSGPPATAVSVSAGGGIAGGGASGQVTYIPGNNNVCVGGSAGFSTPGPSISAGVINSSQNVDVTTIVSGPSTTLSVTPGCRRVVCLLWWQCGQRAPSRYPGGVANVWTVVL